MEKSYPRYCRCGKCATVAVSDENKRVKVGAVGSEPMCAHCYREWKDENYHYKRHIKATCGG